jgi:hypothetical protein
VHRERGAVWLLQVPRSRCSPGGSALRGHDPDWKPWRLPAVHDRPGANWTRVHLRPIRTAVGLRSRRRRGLRVDLRSRRSIRSGITFRMRCTPRLPPAADIPAAPHWRARCWRRQGDSRSAHRGRRWRRGAVQWSPAQGRRWCDAIRRRDRRPRGYDDLARRNYRGWGDTIRGRLAHRRRIGEVRGPHTNWCHGDCRSDGERERTHDSLLFPCEPAPRLFRSDSAGPHFLDHSS